MALIDYKWNGASWLLNNLQVSETGDPIHTAALDNVGTLIPDDYTITLSAVGGGTATATVTTASPSNPYRSEVRGTTTVTLDSATQDRNTIPGMVLVWKTGAVNGNSVVLSVSFEGTHDATAGVTTTGVRHKVVNDSSSVVNGCKARLLTQAIDVVRVGKVFAAIKPFAPGATEKVQSGTQRTIPYAVTIDNVTGAGASKVADLLIDGAAFGASSIRNKATGTLSNSTGLKAVSPLEYYEVVTGPLTGLQFAIDAAAADDDRVNVLIFPSRYVQIAPDNAGAPGTWGTADVVLTSSGQTAGRIAAAGEAFYWKRIVVPSGSAAESNPYPTMVALQYEGSTEAGWTE